MNYSIGIPLGTSIPQKVNKYMRLPWYDFGGSTALSMLHEIIRIAADSGCCEVGYDCPYGNTGKGCVESNQMPRLKSERPDLYKIIVDANNLAHKKAMSTYMFGGIGKPPEDRGWFVPFGVLAENGNWLLPSVNSFVDRRYFLNEAKATKAAGFNSWVCDQLSRVNRELKNLQGYRWAIYLNKGSGIKIIGEAHWPDDAQTDMYSLGRDIDARGTKSRHPGVRDMFRINGLTRKDPTKPESPENMVRSAQDQVNAARRATSMGFWPVFEVNSAENMREIARLLK